MKLWLTDLPIPPQTNHQYMPRNGRLIKSNTARLYDAQMQLYGARHAKHLSDIGEALKPHMRDSVLRVCVCVVFHESRVYSKTSKAKDRVKALDAANRLKSLHDHLARMIGIDDRMFFDCQVIKLTCPRLDEETTFVSFEVIKPPTLSKLLDEVYKEEDEH